MVDPSGIKSPVLGAWLLGGILSLVGDYLSLSGFRGTESGFLGSGVVEGGMSHSLFSISPLIAEDIMSVATYSPPSVRGLGLEQEVG